MNNRDEHGNLTHVKVFEELDTPCSLEEFKAWAEGLPNDLLEAQINVWQDADRDGDSLDSGAIEFSGWREATDEERAKDERGRKAAQEHLERAREREEQRLRALARSRLADLKRDFPELFK